MKFLVLIQGVPGTGEAPEQMLGLSKAMWAWSRQLTESGKCDLAYALADEGGGLTGGFGIMNVQSLEELAEALATCPGAGYVNIEVHPLVAPETAEKLIDSRLGAAVAR